MPAMPKAAIVFLALLCSGCAGLFGPREVRLPLATLQQQLESRFPSHHRYLALFDVNLREPRLRLQPELNRVQITMACTVVPLLANRHWNGSLTLSGALQVDAARHALMLAQPRLEQLALDGVNDDAAGVGRMAALPVQRFLGEVPLYSFGEQGFRYAGGNFMPTAIRIEQNALVVTFEPVK